MSAAEVIDVVALARDTPRPWEPRDLARANDTMIRLVKLDGEFPWHTHEDDELFLCWDGAFRIEIEGRAPVELRGGQLFVVPHGARHRPVTTRPAVTLLIKKPETLQYGDQTR
jgi:mannose-6-phosphate isomerase-like protein (cupin superfamily)